MLWKMPVVSQQRYGSLTVPKEWRHVPTHCPRKDRGCRRWEAGKHRSSVTLMWTVCWDSWPNLGSLCISSHAVRICENSKSPIMGKHRIWLIFTQPSMRVLFSCSAHKECYELHLAGLAPTTLWGKGKLTCHAADIHQPPLGFSKKRQKHLRDFHSPEEVHGHASFVFGHGNEFPIGW